MNDTNNHRGGIIPDGKVRTWGGTLTGWDGPIPPLEDFLVQLGRIPRFAGATEPEFTVLQHSYHAYLIALAKNPEVALQALLHDFGEILIGDIPSPMKVREYTVYEQRFVELAAKSFGLDLDWSEKVWAKIKMNDHLATGVEGRHLMTGNDWAEYKRDTLDKVLAIPHDRSSAGGELHNVVGKIIEEAV